MLGVLFFIDMNYDKVRDQWFSTPPFKFGVSLLGKLYHRVRNAVNDLKEKNEKLVLLNAFRWSSWSRAMDFAEFMKQLSAKMSIDSIRDSSKIFDLK